MLSDPIGCHGRVTASGAITAGRTGEVMVAMDGGVQAFMARDADGGAIAPYEEIVRAAAESFRGVDNLTILNGAAGVGEIMNQVIGQAGPALRLARETLGQTSSNGHASKPEKAVPGPLGSDAPEA